MKYPKAKREINQAINRGEAHYLVPNEVVKAFEYEYENRWERPDIKEDKLLEEAAKYHKQKEFEAKKSGDIEKRKKHMRDRLVIQGHRERYPNPWNDLNYNLEDDKKKKGKK